MKVNKSGCKGVQRVTKTISCTPLEKESLEHSYMVYSKCVHKCTFSEFIIRMVLRGGCR